MQYTKITVPLMLMLMLAWGHAAGDEALSFSSPVALTQPERRVDAVELTMDAAGRPHLIWVDKGPAGAPAPGAGHDRHHARDDLYYMTGQPDLVFGEPVRVTQEDGEVWGFSVSRPRLQITDSGVRHVMYPANATRNGADEAVARYSRSMDGRTWEAARTLNTAGNYDFGEMLHGGISAAHVFGALAAAPDGSVYAYWIDSRGIESSVASDGTLLSPLLPAAIWGAVSRDEGKTFGEDFPVIPSDVCPCCQLTTAFGDDGKSLYLALRDVDAQSNRDNILVVSRDRGESFSAPVALNDTRWNIQACPLKATAIAASDQDLYGAWYSAAESPPGVFVTVSHDGGRTHTAPLAMHPEASLADAPSIAVGGGMVYVAWHARVEGARRIYMRASSDRGRNWGPLQQVPAPEGGNANHPIVAADRNGAALVTWIQDGRAWIVRAKPAERGTHVAQN